MSQIFRQSVQGLRSSDTPNFHFSLTCCVALTTVYALPCDTVMIVWYRSVFQLSDDTNNRVYKLITDKLQLVSIINVLIRSIFEQ